MNEDGSPTVHIQRVAVTVESARPHRTHPAAPLEVTIRRANIDDVDDICRLIDYWEQQGENLPRSREDVIEGIADFGVAEVDDRVVGCGCLYLYTTKLAEIRSVGVDPDLHGGGIGSRLVRHLIDRARELHIPRVFVLTRAPEFFGRLGFVRESIDALPEKVWKDCAICPKQTCCDEIPMIHGL